MNVTGFFCSIILDPIADKSSILCFDFMQET